MVSHFFRTVAVFVRAWWAPAIGVHDESNVSFRVMPGDLDVNVHLNNGRYLALMDLGRFDLVIRTGMGRAAWRHGWHPVIGSAMVRFRRSLSPLQKFQLRTRLLGWDDRWFVFEQRFESEGLLYAVALARGLFRDRNSGAVSPRLTLDAAGLSPTSPPLPDYVAGWARADDAAAAAAATRDDDGSAAV